MNRLWDGISEADVDFAQMAAMSTDCPARVTQSLREASRKTVAGGLAAIQHEFRTGNDNGRPFGRPC